VTLPDPFSRSIKANEIHGRRKKTEKAQWGTAAPSFSAQFKNSSSLKSKPKAKRWDRKYLTPVDWLSLTELL
jgi:aromatic amino acid aminotransferase I